MVQIGSCCGLVVALIPASIFTDDLDGGTETEKNGLRIQSWERLQVYCRSGEVNAGLTNWRHSLKPKHLNSTKTDAECFA